ncbi:M20/M25/M40 family metallo-hydrolase [Halocynthiibacter sp. C4]|uniref:M20 family metallopeptidase n=1 Tax=Halocynthiibacter sp. C4 TaxID=2992758 RepID=UPI00237C4537|nr:M20/M25/M40 family metallo-hydrolase [Halocynthiibacter sp. C4]MDE0591505.1 M20/M25/M40 family metallo-hydrolase [Halocynthiibacter sp. C4]
MAKNLEQALKQAQDRTQDIDLLKSALSINSITGQESRFAEFLASELKALGLSTDTGEFLEDRLNVWAATPEASEKNLMIVGHTDTVHVRGWEDFWGDDPRSNPFAGVEQNGEIWGRGASDLKGGICAAIAGLRLLQSAGFEPENRLTFAFIGDEESGEPGTGVSAGAKDLVKRIGTGEIAKPDFAVYVEPSNLDVFTAQIGFFIADVTVTGKTAYFGTPEIGVDALKATHELIARLWAHEAELAEGPTHELLGPSSLLITHLEAGGFIAVPGESKFSLIRKLRPGEQLDDAVASFESALKLQDLPEGISVDVSYPAGRDHPNGGSPVEISRDTEAALLLQDCVQAFRPDCGAFAGAPFWSEMPFLTDQVGCPTVYFAPGDIAVAHTFEERIDIEDYLAAVRSFALFIARYCGVKPKEKTPTEE